MFAQEPLDQTAPWYCQATVPRYQLDWRWSARYQELVQYDANRWLTPAAFSPAEWETWTQVQEHPVNEERQQSQEALMTQSREREILASLSEGREPHLQYPRIPIAEVRRRIEGLRSLAEEVAHHEPNAVIRRFYLEVIEENLSLLQLIQATHEGNTQAFWQHNRALHSEPTPEEMERALSQVARLIASGRARADLAEVSEMVWQMLQRIHVPIPALPPPTQGTIAQEDRSKLAATPRMVSAQTAQRFFDAVMRDYGFDGWHTVIDAAATGPYVESFTQCLTLQDRVLSLERIRTLLSHEIECYVFRAAMGAKSPVDLLGTGTAFYRLTEEGLAKYYDRQTAEGQGNIEDEFLTGSYIGTLATGLACGVLCTPLTFSHLYQFLVLQRVLLGLINEVIARRHMRSLVLQDFFFRLFNGRQQKGLFGAWGSVSDFINYQAADRLRQFIATNREPLIARCSKIVNLDFLNHLRTWIDELVQELQAVVNRSDAGDDLLEKLIDASLLPEYAFPVDVVSLSIPSYSRYSQDSQSSEADAMQRDLKIALAEYAPGAEVIRGEFPNTYIYRSTGVYDPFEREPDYHPTGLLVECWDCQSIALIAVDGQVPDQCEECGSWNLVLLSYLRPRGFTVDAALRDAGRELYKGGGRERAGTAQPAKLLVGQTSFNTGKRQGPFAPHLYTRVRTGELFSYNKGPNPDFPGFLICPVCGRSLDAENPGSHKYPSNVPPHKGKSQGPRAGHVCPNTSEFQNQVILGHKFFSEVILLGVDLPQTMDAPFREPAGKAAWYSFGTLIANAAALVLQIDPGELKVGARAVKRAPNRIHGEIFLYDDVPGGAGYAHSMERNLEQILKKALELGEACYNPNCSGACYHCMYDYRNQMLHPLLERELGAALLRYTLHGVQPALDPKRVEQGIISFAEFARSSWEIKPGFNLSGQHFPCVLQDRAGQQIGLWIIHPLQARPTGDEKRTIFAQSGMRCAVHTSFDLERRPFWVLNNLVTP